MAWEASLSETAWDEVRRAIFALPRRDLLTIYGEWHSQFEEVPEQMSSSSTTFDRVLYRQALERADNMTNRQLSNAVLWRVEALRTMDTGGHRVWLCPYGCHTFKL